jgi:hypothetical protein
MSKTQIKLEPSTSVIINAAAQIYAAYVTAGQETLASDEEFANRSVLAAIKIAQRASELVGSDS